METNMEPAPLDYDYYCFLRCKEFNTEDDSPRLRDQWERSRKKGNWEAAWDRKRRSDRSPGRFWANTAGGWYLNSRYSRGSSAYRIKNP